MKKFALVAVILLGTTLIPVKSFASYPIGGGGAVAVGLLTLFGGSLQAAKPTKTTTEFAFLNSIPSDKFLINLAASGAKNTAEILYQ